MKVLLLGPNGQLGHDLTAAHAAAPDRVAGGIELIPFGRDKLDVSAPAGIAETLSGVEFDALVNCTSYHKTDEVEDAGSRAMAVNAHAPQQLARICAERGARFVHISTDYVFGGDTARATPLPEDAPTAPVNVYGASKALGETLASLAGEPTILRVASLYGVAGASGKGGNFVETMIRFGRERGALKVVDDQRMSPTATADIAVVILRMLREGAAPGLWHVAGGGEASWFEFASEIIRQAGIEADMTPCASSEFPTRALRPGYSVLDASKLASAFAPMPDWRESLGRYLKAKGHLG
ncbi:dTDP-4-dehydrorhamnose reductase [uncultured Albimonas sp.]|uniref:dTDP-4-dehydrorhamnose reductase n=1 Tax=uncultured Albimonas sp. TaxID=1331701 RepID=UPI0030EC6652|tara:strand:- start:100 stop:987 length:888 start_codon:yes stop_codon:yes gene_type:complete